MAARDGLFGDGLVIPAYPQPRHLGRMGQTVPNEATQVLRVGTGDRGVGGDPPGGRRPAQDLPHRRGTPIVADHVHRGIRRQRGDDGLEIVGEPVQRIGRGRLGHR